MKWELLPAGPTRKALKRMPAADRRRVLAALDAMEQDPFHMPQEPEACRG